MKKGLTIGMTILLLMVLAAGAALCVHCSMLPEATTQYYEQKAAQEAQNEDSAEAELMRLLLGGGAAAAEPKEPKVFAPFFNRYGLLLSLSALAGILVFFARNEKKTGHFAAALMAAVFGLLGSRLFYAAANFGFYVLDIGMPAAMLRIWEGGLSLSGALAGAALGAWLGAKIGKIPAGKTLDQLIPGLLLFAAGARLSEMAIDAGFGMEMNSALWIFTRDTGDGYRLNTALLMALIDLLLMIAVVWKKDMRAGDRSWLGTFLYGGVHILLESLRRDGHMLLGFVHMEQLFALLIALPALLIFAVRARKIWMALPATAVLSVAVIGLEFALDRSNIGDGILYLVYALLLCGYLLLGLHIYRKQEKLFRQDQAIQA